jgi:hypothetical protein
MNLKELAEIDKFKKSDADRWGVSVSKINNRKIMNLRELIGIDKFERSDADNWGVLVEELTVGNLGEKNMRVSVFTESLKNPSFHFKSNDFEIVFQIKDFKILEIKFGDVQDIEGKNFKKLLSWFKQPSNKPKMTNWQKMLNNWNTVNPESEVDENLQMPL